MPRNIDGIRRDWDLIGPQLTLFDLKDFNASQWKAIAEGFAIGPDGFPVKNDFWREIPFSLASVKKEEADALFARAVSMQRLDAYFLENDGRYTVAKDAAMSLRDREEVTGQQKLFVDTLAMRTRDEVQKMHNIIIGFGELSKPGRIQIGRHNEGIGSTPHWDTELESSPFYIVRIRTLPFHFVNHGRMERLTSEEWRAIDKAAAGGPDNGNMMLVDELLRCGIFEKGPVDEVSLLLSQKVRPELADFSLHDPYQATKDTTNQPTGTLHLSDRVLEPDSPGHFMRIGVIHYSRT